MIQTLGDVMKTVLKYGIAHILVGLCLIPLTSSGHHGRFGRYDLDSFREIEGEVTEVSWNNPHAYFTVEATDGVTWQLETGSPTLLLRTGIPRDSIKVGEYIKVAGNPPLTTTREMYVSNVLLESGEELILDINIEPRWADEGIGDNSVFFHTEGDPTRPELGLFRIWSHTDAIPWLFPELTDRSFDMNSYPMTPMARAALEKFDPATDNPTRNCTPKGMPTIMEQPYPQEFVQDGSNILLHLEEYDVQRTIHMGQDVTPTGTQASPLGYSVGRWEEATLVVTTTHLNWPWFNQFGMPQSEESVLVERFTPTEDGSRLDYELTVDDPVNFTEPVTLEKYWLYLVNEEILPFDCTLRN